MKYGKYLKQCFALLLCAGGANCCGHAGFGQVRVLVDQVGYETLAQKQAIVEGSEKDSPQKFALVDTDSGKTVYEADLQPSGKVFAWDGRMFWTADFSSWQKTGHYAVEVQTPHGYASSCAFDIRDNALQRCVLFQRPESQWVD